MKNIITRNRSTSFSIMCFDSVVLENDMVVEEEGSKPTKGVEPVVPPAVNIGSDVKDEDIVGWKNKPGRRSFARYVKAVLFETSLMKKMKTKKLGQKLYKNCTNGKYSKPKSKTKNYDTFCEDNPSTRSNNIGSTFSTTTKNSSSLSRTTSSSSLSGNSRIKSAENNLQKQVEKGFYGSNVGIFLLLVSLLVLVIWGKVCAIFCTSTWLFCVCRWSTIKPVASSENIAVDHRHNRFPAEIDTEGYKKKVIMEGLLDRDHGRNRFP